jgi:predicted DNA-binding WGR domain protein
MAISDQLFPTDAAGQMLLFPLSACVTRADTSDRGQVHRDGNEAGVAALIGRTRIVQPEQRELFSEQASLRRIRPEKNEWRYYRLEVWPDLFGRALLVRHFGRIGTAGRRKLEPFSDAGAAVNMLGRLLRAKLRRGYAAR